jgi:hypothetical protein
MPRFGIVDLRIVDQCGLLGRPPGATGLEGTAVEVPGCRLEKPEENVK